MFGRYIERYLLVWLVALSSVALFWNHFRTHADRNRAGPLVVRRKSRVTLFYSLKIARPSSPGLDSGAHSFRRRMRPVSSNVPMPT